MHFGSKKIEMSGNFWAFSRLQAHDDDPNGRIELKVKLYFGTSG